MSDNRGIFTLDELYELQVSGLFEHINDVWIYARNIKNDFGFYAGYHDGGHSYVTNIYRHDFSDDTITSASQLTVAKSQMGAVSSSDYGYFFGGKNPSSSVVSNVDRLDFNNNTTATSPKGNLANPINICDSAGNASYGYAHGLASTSYATYIHRIDYANDTATAPAHLNFPAAKYYGAAMGNQNYGYWAGGSAPGPSYTKTSTIHRVDYSNDTADASPKGTLNNIGVYGNNTQTSGQGNADYGYVAGGYIFAAVTNVRRIDYSNDTAVTVDKGNLASQMAKGASTGNHSNGYFAGGSNVSSIQKVDFSNDTATATAVASLTGAGNSPYFIGDSGTSPLENGNPITYLGAIEGIPATTLGPAMGYVLGGAFPYSFSIVDRMDYSNDTATMAVKGPLSAGTSYQAAVSSKDHGYSMGGKTPSNGKSSKVDRVDYANDTATAAVKGPLSAGVYRSYAGVGNKDYGYHSGGNRPGTSSTIDRIEYASDTSTATPKGNLASARYLHSGAGNLSYGYQIGGSPPFQNNSVVQRIDYGNDTATAVTKGNLNQGSRKATSTGNASYGYVGGGTNPNLSQITRIDYSNDTATSVAKGPLTVDRASLSSFSAPGHGYFAGGNYTMLSSVDRMDYSNDTATAVAKGPLSSARGYNSGVSSRDIGGSLSTTSKPARKRFSDGATETPAGTAAPGHAYFAGGGPSPSGKTIVDRLDFSNDSAAMAPKGSLSQSRKQLTAVGSPSYAYMMGGYDANASPGYELSYIDRIDYASDTSTATPKGLLAEGTYYAGATGTASYGYNGGGRASSGVISCTVQRIDYSNDTATASPKGYLTIRRRNFAGCVGNTSYGYWSGGENNASTFISTTERVDFSNDTAAAVVKGPVDGPVRGASDGTGNANYGYYAGGYYPDSPAPAHRYSIVSRIDYSSDTGTIPTKAALSNSLSATGAAGNASYGYWGAGADPSGLKTSVDRIDFSNDTSTPTVVTAYLSNARAQAGAASGLMYGLPQTASAAVAAPVQPPFPFPVQAHNPANYGYFAGGYDGTNPSGPTGDLTIVQRIDFSNDTATASLRGNLANTPGSLKSTSSNRNYGYVVGGSTVPSVSYVERIDYANDSATALVRGPLGGPVRGSTAGAGNNDYGWHTGGMYALPSRTNYSLVERIDYSNDSSTTSTRGPLVSARCYHNATGTLNYGYFAAGSPNGAFGPNSSTVQRIDYGNDTGTASPKGPLAHSTSQLGSTGNANYGWFIAGYGPARSKISRVDYANDTATASARGPLYQPSYRLEGTGNANYGYVHPGLYPSNPAGPDGSTDVARIDYSNDTTTTSTKGHFARAYQIQEGGVSAAENGRT